VLRHAYDALVAPAADAIDAARELIIVPHGPLHQLPFAALADAGQRALLDRARRIWHAPSATVRLRAAARLPGAPSLPCLAISCDGDLGELRHTGPEARAVAERCGGDLWANQAGARQRLIAEAGRYRLLHLACHGLFDLDDPQASWLEVGPGERLTAAEVHAELRLAAELVVLSACRSGVSRVLRGDEPIGLARAFLGAGARAVLVTLWPVEDSSARLLIEHFYAELLRGGARPDAPDAADALRSAQIALRSMSAGEAAARLGAPPPVAGPQPYADPRYWAAYVLVVGAG
jgi:CHAT domain-containing protein